MEAKKAKPTTIDEYIGQYPPAVQEILNQIRAVVKEEAPQAVEKISYGLPTFYQNGNLVHFGAHSRHIGFYPTPSGMEAFKQELTGYKGSKGSVQFPLDQPMPYDLIRRIVKFRLSQNQKATA